MKLKSLSHKLVLSALIALGGLLVTPAAIACQDSGSGRCGNVGYSGNRDNSAYYGGYGGYGGGGYSSYSTPAPTRYITDYLALFFDKQDRPYFYRERHVEYYADDWTQKEWDAAMEKGLAQCNRSPSRAPCEFNTQVANRGCIAYLYTPDMHFIETKGRYSTSHENCLVASEAVHQRCMSKYKDANMCRSIRIEKP